MAVNVSVLVLAFNRPDLTQQCLDAVIAQHPKHIFVSCDGPRSQFPNETDAVKRLIQRYLDDGLVAEAQFLPENLGLLDGVKAGIDWFFEKTEVGLIIEDDLVINAPGLVEGQKLLEALSNHPSARTVCLRNLVPVDHLADPDASYFVSQLFSPTAWGTSRENWQSCELSMLGFRRDFQTFRFWRMLGPVGWLAYFLRLSREEANEFRGQRHNLNWDYHFQWAQWRKGQTFLYPIDNRVEYRGWDSRASHASAPELGVELLNSLSTHTGVWVPATSVECDARAQRYQLALSNSSLRGLWLRRASVFTILLKGARDLARISRVKSLKPKGRA